MTSDQMVSPASVASSDLHPASDQADDDYIDDTPLDDAEEADSDDGDDESDFAPEPEDDAPKGGRKGKGKAKSTKAAAAKTGSPAAAKRTGSAAPLKGNWTVPENSKRSTVMALEASELMAYPPAYRDYLLAASATIARTQTERAPSGGVKLSSFPLGPVTPFTTRLTEPYDGGIAQIDVTLDPKDATEREKKRRDDAREAAKRVTVCTPWDLWQGEPWYKEMYNGDSMDTNGDDEGGNLLPSGWRLAPDVHLRLEGVEGKERGASVELSSSAGQRYLPRSEPITLSIGAANAQKRAQLALFDSVPFETASEVSSGVVFNSGGPVWGLDWCPYPERLSADIGSVQFLAISTAQSDSAIGSRGPPDAPGVIQVWTVNHEANKARCGLVLCLEGGAALDLKWMPLGAWDDGGDSPRLGVLAAVQEDGSVSFYSVPRLASTVETKGDPVYIRATPLLKLSIPDAACTCIAWLSALRIAAGLSDGHVVVWDLDVFESSAVEQPLPSLYIPATISPIRSVAAGRCPTTAANGNYDYSGDAVFLAYSSWDGSVGMVDLRDSSAVIEINRARLPAMAIAWSPQLATPVYADVDYMVSLAQIRLQGPYNYLLAPHRGPLWDIATSDYHTMVASCASDGAVILSNSGMGFYRRKMGGLLYQRLYELDWDEHSNEYRMTDSFMPEASSLEEALKHAKKKGGKAAEPQVAPTEGDAATVKTAVWTRNVGVHKVAWQCGAGLGRAGWLASGGWAGLVRVDLVNGQQG